MQKLILLFIASIIGYNTFGQKISGTVISKSDNLPLQYVNIGVLSKNIGAITDSEGNFTLESSKILKEDSIRISMIGFKSQTYCLNDWQNNSVIKLDVDVVGLDEIVVYSIPLQSKTLGTKAQSRKVVTGWCGYGVGSERGLKISSKKYPIFVDELNFFIAKNDYDKIIFFSFYYWI